MNFLEPKHDSEKIDLAFVIHCTGSMGSYIKQVQKHVTYIAETIAKTSFDVRLGLIEYRDHPPQGSSFITGNHDFTADVKAMKTWVDQMQASGGGDCPEAMADALRAASKLSYRKQATKLCFLITDAPPHGLGEAGDGFPNGCPDGHDTLESCHTMAELGVVLYCIGCEPSVGYFKDFLHGLSHITGGQYVSLRKANTLTKVIINAAAEEISLEKLMGHVSDVVFLQLKELKKNKKKIKFDELVDKVYQNLKNTNNKCQTLHANNAPLPQVTKEGKQYSRMRKMSQARVYYQKNRKTEYGQNMVVEDGDVGIAQGTLISWFQTQRLVTKVLKRPCVHNEDTNEIEQYDDDELPEALE